MSRTFQNNFFTVFFQAVLAFLPKTLLSAIPIPDPVQERQRKVKIYVDTDSDAEEWKENSPGHFVLKRQEGGKKSAKE